MTETDPTVLICRPSLWHRGKVPASKAEGTGFALPVFKTLLHSRFNGGRKKENGGYQAHLDLIWARMHHKVVGYFGSEADV